MQKKIGKSQGRINTHYVDLGELHTIHSECSKGPCFLVWALSKRGWAIFHVTGSTSPCGDLETWTRESGKTCCNEKLVGSMIGLLQG